MLATVRGVEIFASGTHRGETYTEEDLRCMVRNYYQFRELVKPPTVIGHEEDQALMENTGIPATGRVVNPRLRQDANGLTLVADFVDVPNSIAKLIGARAYSKVSSEVYDEPPEGCVGGKGKMLRRVALLGGELPQIKTLADLPTPDYAGYSETHKEAKLSFAKREKTKAGTFRVFYEVRPMSKKWKKFADLSAKTQANLKKFDEMPMATDAGAAPPAPVAREELIAMLTEMGYDPSLLTEAVPDNVLAEMVRVVKSMMQEQPTQQLSDEPPAPAKTPEEEEKEKAAAAAAQAMSQQPTPGAVDRHPQTITMKYSELEDLVNKAIDKALKPTRDDVSKFKEETGRAAIDAEFKTLVNEGKVLPAEIDAGACEVAYALDNVKKFSDGKTALRKYMDTLKARPQLVNFAERAKAGKPGSQHDTANAELAKVKRFSETPNIAHALKAKGQTPEDYVREFEAAKKKVPSLTAEQFGVPGEAA